MVLSNLRKHRFFESGVCLKTWLDDKDIVQETLHDVMRKNKYVPVLGTESVRLTDVDDRSVSFKVSIDGAYVGDSIDKVQYITREGVTVWNRTPKDKFDKFLMNLT